MSYHDQMFFEGATPAGTLSFTDDSLEIDFQPSPKYQAQVQARRNHRLATVLSIAGAILAGLFVNVDVAHAGWGAHHHDRATVSITKTVPVVYDASWKLRKSGSGRLSPGELVGFNPQPDPPGFD